MFLLCSCGSVSRMNDNYDIPVERSDLLFTIEMALLEAESFWPRKYVPGDHDRLKPAARAVVAYLERYGVRCYRRRPAPLHGTPDPFGTPGRSGGGNRPDGAAGE